jgi:serine/threonine protein phosphatase PrpC
LQDARFIILATDGLWDFLSMDLAVHLVSEWGPDEPDPATRLTDYCLHKIAFKCQMDISEVRALPKGETSRAWFDDISVIVYWFAT